MERKKLLNDLLKHFFKAVIESLKPFQNPDEAVDYLETLIALQKGIISEREAVIDLDMPAITFDSDEFIRKNILLQFKSKAKPFVDGQLRYFFEKDPGMQVFLFQHLKIEESILNEEEFERYCDYTYQILHNMIERIYIKGVSSATAEHGNEIKSLTGAEQEPKGFKSTSKEYTRSRQIMLYFFLLKLMGMGRLDNSMRKYAQFAHVLFAWPVDNIDNSGVYKALKRAPAFGREDASTLKDLEFIKSQFQLIDSAEGAALVQKEIDMMKR